MIATIALYAIIGGIWRRILGGWFALRRSYIVAFGAMMTAPAWLLLPWWEAAILVGILALFFLMGHRFDRGSIIFRYPLIGAIYRVGERYWPKHYTAVAEVVIGAVGWATFAAWCFRG
jgi:hypothetical protein